VPPVFRSSRSDFITVAVWLQPTEPMAEWLLRHAVTPDTAPQCRQVLPDRGSATRSVSLCQPAPELPNPSPRLRWAVGYGAVFRGQCHSPTGKRTHKESEVGEWAMESGRGFFISKVRLGLIGSDLVGFSGSRVGFTWIWSDWAGFSGPGSGCWRGNPAPKIFLP